MSVSFSLLTAGSGNGLGGKTATTASISETAGVPIIIGVGCADNVVATDITTVSITGTSIEKVVPVASSRKGAAATSGHGISWFLCLATGSAGTLTITADGTGISAFSEISWAIYSVSGTDIYPHVVATTASGTGTTASVTLTNYLSTSGSLLLGYSDAATAATTFEGGWTEDLDNDGSDGGEFAGRYNTPGDSTPSATVANDAWGVSGLEVKATVGLSAKSLTSAHIAATTAQTSASVSPTAYSLICVGTCWSATTSPTDISISTTLSGVSFTELLPVARYTTGQDHTYKAWWAIMGSSPGSGTITLTPTGTVTAGYLAYSVDEFVLSSFLGEWKSNSINPSNTGTNYSSSASSITATAGSAFAAINSLGYGIAKKETVDTVDPITLEQGWNILSSPLYTSARLFMTGFKMGTDNSLTISSEQSVSQVIGGAIMELSYETVGGGWGMIPIK